MSANERAATRAWREAMEHLDRLLQQAPAERAGALADLSVSRPDIHSLVSSLLAAEARASSGAFHRLGCVERRRA
jgi:hypothetical protein